MKPLLVLMGVSGSGKTTVGEVLAAELGIPFADADDMHSESNVRKMAAGQPLTDEDRSPWLRRVGQELRNARESGLVVACSALKRQYRDMILSVEPAAKFVLMDGPKELFIERLSMREGHFMPASLLDSQLDTLERLTADEPGVVVTVDGDPADVAHRIVSSLGL